MSDDVFQRNPNHAASLERLRRTVRIRMKRQAFDLAHDFGHIQRVWRNAQLVGSRCASDDGWTVDGDIVEAACLLHEIGRGAERRGEHHSDTSARIADGMLRNEGLGDLVWPVAETIISHMGGGRTPDTPEGRVLRDADLLEELGAIGVARVLLTGATHATPALYEPNDPRAHDRPLDDGAYLLDRFPRRLFGIVTQMETPFGRVEAEWRTTILRAYYNAFLREAGYDGK